MPQTLFEHLSPDTGAKRILALDGGGVRAMLTLGLLQALESELRRRAGGAANFRLSDYYDLIGGAGLGALAAMQLALGFSVQQAIDFHRRHLPEMFGAGGDRLHRPKLDAGKLRRALDAAIGGRRLDSDDLRTGLAVQTLRVDNGVLELMRNGASDGWGDQQQSAGALPSLADVVLASAAAGSPFDALAIEAEQGGGLFADAPVSGAQLGLHLMAAALDPKGGLGWHAGAERLAMTSCGTGSRAPRLTPAELAALPADLRAAQLMRAAAHAANEQAAAIMQALGATQRPWPAGAEPSSIPPAPLLDYQRLDVVLDLKRGVRRGDPAPPITALERLIGRELSSETLEALDGEANGAPDNLELLLEVGAAAGRSFVGANYPDARFDPPEWGR